MDPLVMTSWAGKVAGLVSRVVLVGCGTRTQRVTTKTQTTSDSVCAIQDRPVDRVIELRAKLFRSALFLFSFVRA